MIRVTVSGDELIKALKYSQSSITEDCVVRIPSVDGDNCKVVVDIATFENGYEPREVDVREFFDGSVDISGEKLEEEAREKLKDGIWIDGDDDRIAVVVDK